MKCPACGLLAYPRLAPAMITLVTKGEPGPDQQVLLARGVQFRAPMYSCLAGFVEPGESLEEAVIREVQEEVGVVIGSVEYRGSQPWPFPHSLMIGFRAAWESGEIVCEPTEILVSNPAAHSPSSAPDSLDVERSGGFRGGGVGRRSRG